MKFFKELFCIVIILISSSLTVYALDQGFYSSIALSIDSVGTEGLEFDEEDIKGEYTTDILRNITLDNLANNGYQTRSYNNYQYVAVPPYSKIDILYYWYNNTPNIVNVDKIRIPLSRQITQRGDVTKITEDIGFEEGVNCTESICKGGKYLEVDGVGLLDSDIYEDAKGGVRVATLTVLPPIEITKYELTYLSEYTTEVNMYIRNNTNEYLTNVHINYVGNIDQSIKLEAYQEIILTVYKQCTFFDNEINCGTVRIKDPNTKTHCMIYGSGWDGYNNPDSITVFNKIDEEWIPGARVQPALESFCIKRLPYRYTTQEMIAYIEPPEPESTQDQYWSNLLNIHILPVTSYKPNIFEYLLRLIKPLRIDTL